MYLISCQRQNERKEGQVKILKICQKSSFQNWNWEHPFFIFLVPIIASSRTKILFFKNKDIILTIMYLSQVRRETEFSPRTGKPNKKASKTGPDNRQSFINKDVLSMKIITAAKQNMAQDPELLSEVCQQTLLKETVQQRGQGWRHKAFFPLYVPLHLSQSTFQQYDLLICVPCREGPKGPEGPELSSSLIIRDDVSASSARLPCVVSVGFCRVGEGWGGQQQKNREIKAHNNTFFYHLLCPLCVWKWASQDPKTHKNNTLEENNTQGSLCFRNFACSLVFLFISSSLRKYQEKKWHFHFSIASSLIVRIFPKFKAHYRYSWSL